MVEVVKAGKDCYCEKPMATRVYREGKKLFWDRTKEEIVDHPVNI